MHYIWYSYRQHIEIPSLKVIIYELLPLSFCGKAQGLFGGLCFFKENLKVGAKKPRTIIYIDGFNLYYGALKGTKFKWLDLQTLFHKLLGEHHTITEIKYFTARISAREGDSDAPNRQDAYLKALETHIPNISIHYGHFLTNLVKAKFVVGPGLYRPIIEFKCPLQRS